MSTDAHDGGSAIVTRDDVNSAYERISGFIRRTPTITVGDGSFGTDTPVVLKLESLQHTGSFKARGAFNRLIGKQLASRGVIAASGGNHGKAVAHAARRLGVPAEIFVPEVSSSVKVEGMRREGATVTVGGALYFDAFLACQERAHQTGALLVHAYDQPDVVAGQGTVAVELSSQAPEVETVLIAVGGGGLIAGCASWYQHGARIVAVEPKGIPTFARAMEARRPVDIDVSGLAADSLGAKRIGDIAYDVGRRFVQASVLVSDDMIRHAQRVLWEEVRVLAEPGGATALAAVLSGAYPVSPGERLAVVICGGNVDPATMASG